MNTFYVFCISFALFCFCYFRQKLWYVRYVKRNTYMCWFNKHFIENFENASHFRFKISAKICLFFYLRYHASIRWPGMSPPSKNDYVVESLPKPSFFDIVFK